MDTQTLLAFLGIAATVVLGIWAIIITVRYNRNVRITYAHDQAIALTDDITQNFPELGITFRGEPVSQNLVLLKGYVINTGKKDISRDMVEERITLTLPDEYEWVECKVVESSPSLKATAEKTDNRHVSFETGLWKTKEYMKFEALAKIPVIRTDLDKPLPARPTLRLRKALSFTHRIADSTRILQTRVPRPLGKATRFQLSMFPFHLMGPGRFGVVMALVMFIAGTALWSGGRFWHTNSLGYGIMIDGHERLLSAEAKKDKVVLTDDTGFKKECTLAEFDSMAGKQLRFVPKTEREMRIIGLIYAAMGLFMLVLSGIRSFRDNRLLAMIASKEKS